MAEGFQMGLQLWRSYDVDIHLKHKFPQSPYTEDK